jgi:phosphinothricin acetyltransferase
MTEAIAVRPAEPRDAARIAEIYNEGIRARIATFETRERSPEDVLTWLADPRCPVLVAETAGEVLGWVSASGYRVRECYAGIAEFSVRALCARHGFWEVGTCEKHGRLDGL